MIPLLDSLVIKNQKQNVERDGFETIADMKSYSENYLPYLFVSVCYEDKNIYLYCKDNNEDSVTGKWRAIPSNSSVKELKELLENEIANVSLKIDNVQEELEKEFQDAISILDKKVDSNKDELTKIIDNLNTTLSKTISDEKERAETKEQELSESISSLDSKVDSEIKITKELIESEASTRDSADIQLQENIESEATNRTDADSSLDSKISTNKSSIGTINTEIGDFTKITGLSLKDISTAIYAIYYSFMSKMEYANKKLTITYRNGYTTDIDMSPIITDTNIEELKNVSDDSPDDGQALAFDSTTNKYIPKTFDLAKVLQDAKDYTDASIEGMSKADAIACDEEPTYDSETSTVTYKINGETKTKKISTSADTWFFYKDGTKVVQVIFVDGVEFKVVNDSSVDFDDFIRKDSVVNTFTGEETDLTPIPNLGAMMALYNLIKTALGKKVNISDIVDSLTSESTDIPLSANQGRILNNLVSGKVNKVDGKSLSTNDLTNDLKTSYDKAVTDDHTHSNKDVLDGTTASFTDDNYVHTDNNYTDDEKDKLDKIESGAQVNVQSDWGENDSTKDDFIKNKPNAVLYDEQSLTDEQKTQVRTNIDALGKDEKASSASEADNLSGGGTEGQVLTSTGSDTNPEWKDIANLLEVGSIIMSGTDLTSKGYLLCDGSEVKQTDYSELYSKIGNSFGSASDGYFKLPDLINKFAEGTKDELGTVMEAGIPNITGQYDGNELTSAANEATATGAFGTAISSIYSYNADGSSGKVDNMSFNAANGETKLDGTLQNDVYGKSDTVQPAAQKVYFYIKAKNVESLSESAIQDDSITKATTWSSSKIDEEKADKDKVVTLTDEQTISGKKTFVNSLKVQGESGGASGGASYGTIELGQGSISNVDTYTSSGSHTYTGSWSNGHTTIKHPDSDGTIALEENIPTYTLDTENKILTITLPTTDEATTVSDDTTEE